MRRVVILAVAGLLVALTGCDNPVTGSDGPDPMEQAQAAVTTLAVAATDKDVSGIPFDLAKAPQQYADITDQLADFPLTVTGEVGSADQTAATAILHWNWDLNGNEWAYDTTIALTDVDDVWTTTWSPALVHPRLRAKEVFDLDLLPATRSDILGADGPIVTHRPVIRYGFNKSVVPNSKWSQRAGEVASAVGVEVVGFQAKVKAAGPEAFVEAIVYRKADAPSYIDPNFGRIPGALAISDSIPLAPSRTFAAPILGSVGTATAQDAKESDGTIAVGDEIGTSGLQAEFDTQLRGTPGVRVQAYRTQERTLVSFDPIAGTALKVSLDTELQKLGEQVLAEQTSITALVAVRPSDGAILAIANGPANGGFNAATAGQYPPGSTFKVVGSLALLRDGMTPSSTFACPATINVDGRVFKNYSDYPSSGLGTITVTRALANSCNTFFIGSAARLGDDDLTEAATSLGLITDHDLGFDAYFGQVPAPESETVKGANMIGQGMVLSSPLGMATVAASVGKGSTVVPWLVTSRTQKAEVKEPLTTSEAKQLRQMMREVVVSGTGTVLGDLGPAVMAKTGTAEYSTGDGLGTHAWMIAIDGDLAVAVLVEDGASGSHTAGPLMHAFLAGR